ncbi:flavin dependent monooxygenase [Coccidioides posadasii str. Silveira]|uniref:Flavin dependent monooxygenase n=1 Tax=Coccidioides posadasii (strain RMSCC 757 / Silveira) TaxID=443226 RepID=E9DB97_COCPS|nr:flavin dependent monooxygenase [Coccidioides posadasii str. Silveira]
MAEPSTRFLWLQVNIAACWRGQPVKMAQRFPHVRTVAIVGAGAGGLTAAKYLLAEKCFDKIDIFEQRNRVGGVWNYSPASDKARLSIPIPQENANLPVEEPIWHSQGSYDGPETSEQIATFVSPLYNRLETNIPHTLMHYSDLPFAKDTQLFTKFQIQVVDVRLEDRLAGTWAVTRKDLRSGVSRTDIYDAVVVANGHYNVPYVPSIPGISAWHNSYPGIISHSKSYCSSEAFRNKKVIVVGNSASGIDIGAQISRVCRAPLLSSSRSESYFTSKATDDRTEYPPIEEFLPPGRHNRAVRFANGVIEESVDAIVFCTGYLYSFPFLSTLDPPVVEDGSRALRVYQHMFYIEHPTLVFPVLNQKVIPFPVAEAQSAVFARVLSGRLALPAKEDMYEWERSNVAAKGAGKSFHVLAYPLDAEYLNFLHDWAASAETRPSLTRNGQGKEGPCWGEKEKWLRSRFTQIKQAFAARGEERHSCCVPEDLGFDFEGWKREQWTG